MSCVPEASSDKVNGELAGEQVLSGALLAQFPTVDEFVGIEVKSNLTVAKPTSAPPATVSKLETAPKPVRSLI